MAARYTIPARKGAAHALKQGEILRVINTHGSQVVDFWAFSADDLAECMSMEHTRASILKLVPVPGDIMLTNRRRPILTIVEDNSPGVHDTLIASCDVYRYEQLGWKGFHDNCTDNLKHALESLGLERKVHPCPFNLFMHMGTRDGRSLTFEPPVTRPGDSISFRANMDAIVAFSACPQDLVPVNGTDGKIHDAHYEIE